MTVDAVRRMASSVFQPDKLAMAAIGPFKEHAALRGDLESTFAGCLAHLGRAGEPVAAGTASGATEAAPAAE